MYYSQSTSGFYDEAIHGARKIFVTSENVDGDGIFNHTEVDNPDCKIPSDAVEISPEEHAALMDAQAQGKVIAFDEETQKPIAIDRVVTAEEIAAQAKAAKVEALNTIIVTTSTGKVFDGNETARLNMLSAITAAGIVGQNSANWKLADNTVETVTLDELKQALALSIQRVGEIVTA